MDPTFRRLLCESVAAVGVEPHEMPSGAGHDAAVMAGLAPAAMLFVRSPGGVSHHPDEAVLPDDVRLALSAAIGFVERLAASSHERPR
jgi:allantoate deiminase